MDRDDDDGDVSADDFLGLAKVRKFRARLHSNFRPGEGHQSVRESKGIDPISFCLRGQIADDETAKPRPSRGKNVCNNLQFPKTPGHCSAYRGERRIAEKKSRAARFFSKSDGQVSRSNPRVVRPGLVALLDTMHREQKRSWQADRGGARRNAGPHFRLRLVETKTRTAFRRALQARFWWV